MSLPLVVSRLRDRSVIWIWVVVSAAALDLLLRLSHSFRLREIAVSEAALLGIASLVLYLLWKRSPGTGLRSRTQIGALLFLALGAERAAMFAAGVRLTRANFLTLASAVVLAVSLFVWRRLERQRSSQQSVGTR